MGCGLGAGRSLGCGRGDGAAVGVGVGVREADSRAVVGVAGMGDGVGVAVGMALVAATGGAFSATVGGTGPTVAPKTTRDPSPPSVASGRAMRLRTSGFRCGCERGRANPVNHITIATHTVSGQMIIANRPMTIPATSQPRCRGYLLAKIRAKAAAVMHMPAR